MRLGFLSSLATVYCLADRAVSGKTFMPSGGLSLERSITERELFGSAKRERLDDARTHRVADRRAPGRVTDRGRAPARHRPPRRPNRAAHAHRGRRRRPARRAALRDVPPNLLHGLVIGDDLEVGIDHEPRGHGYPTAIVSTPFTPMADKLFASAGHPDAPTLKPEALHQMVHKNLTQQFRVARKPSLIDGIQLVLVSPGVPAGSNPAGAGFALACFIKTSLHAFTATLAVKGEHPVQAVPVKQINHTRRARSGEPRNQADHQEEVKRFGRAVLLAGAPLPDAEDPRYRSRICLGMAITVGVSLPERGGSRRL